MRAGVVWLAAGVLGDAAGRGAAVTLFLALWLYFTTPSQEACPAACYSCPNATTPAEVVLVSSAGDTLSRHAAAAPGAPDSLAFDWDGDPVVVYVVSRSVGSGWSCPSNVVNVGSPVSVPTIMASGPARIEFYDLAGRRVRPDRPGVYFERTVRGNKTVARKVLVVR